jgi:hypothetical protein
MKIRISRKASLKELVETVMFKACSFFLFLLLSSAYLCPAIASASFDLVTFKSAVVWRNDDAGDYKFDEELFSSAGTYEINPAHKSDGIVFSLKDNLAKLDEMFLKVKASGGGRDEDKISVKAT